MAPRIHAVAITYRRPAVLTDTLRAFYAQTRPPDTLLIVDNDADEEVAALAATIDGAEYHPMPDNVGPAGAVAAGMERVLGAAGPDDWILLIDDDDPPPHGSALADVVAVAFTAPADVAVVGLTGARYNPWTGMLGRVLDDELRSQTEVDYVGNNQCPLYRVAAVRQVGVFDPGLFIFLEEIDYGLRLRRAGWRLILDRDATLRARESVGRVALGRHARSARRSGGWRSYYTARNEVLVARRHGRFSARFLVTARVLLGGVRVAVSERRTDVLAARSRGLYDGWRGAVGRTVEPGASSVRWIPGGRFRWNETPAESACADGGG